MAWARRSKLVALAFMLLAVYSLLMAVHEPMWSIWQLFRVGSVLLFGHTGHIIWHRAELHHPEILVNDE